MTATAELAPWQAYILDQLEQIAQDEILDDAAIATRPFLVLGSKDGEMPTILERCVTRDQADEEAVLHAGKGEYDTIRIEELAAVGFNIPAAEPEAGPGEDGAPKGLFDRSDYEREDLQIPKVDGNAIDVIRIKFAGEVKLDRSDPADVALFNRLKLNQEVELRASGTMSKIATGFTTSKDGDLDAVVTSKTITVDTVWILDPEEL